VLPGIEIEFGVVLGVLSETNGAVLVDNASDLHHKTALELLGRRSELNDLDCVL
jgi:hypothetical protein